MLELLRPKITEAVFTFAASRIFAKADFAVFEGGRLAAPVARDVELTARGFRLATSVGGTLTGRGGEIIVIDDPLKPDDALSEAKRSAANQWFTNTLLSRLDDKRTRAIVVVMQRVHIDDLTGFLLAQSDEWDVLSLPAVAYFDEIIPLSAERTYCRQSGEALSPEREPLHVLDALKLQIGSDAFSAQYQQAPAPPGGCKCADPRQEMERAACSG